MRIETVIEYLNKERKYNINAEYYKKIAGWRLWWQGYDPKFHEFVEICGDITRKRRRYSLRMAKKVCEDWAAILLNEKTEILVDDKASNDFVTEVLDSTDFRQGANALVEQAFWSGTGAILLRVSGAGVAPSGALTGETANIEFDYIPANGIIPLTVRHGKIVDCAFVSEVLEGGQKFIYLESHVKEGSRYRITNEYFKDDNGGLTRQPLPQGMAEAYTIDTETPFFAIIKPNILNNIDNNNGLGISVFANALDEIKGVDLAYNNFNRDFVLGGKKVFYRDDLVNYDKEGNAITPDDVMQQLFVQLSSEINHTEEKPLTEYNPLLRVDENKNGIQGQLDYLSFKVGFGTKHYQFNSGTVTTATQYMGDKQELIQTAAKHYIIIENALKTLVTAILWVARHIQGQPVSPAAEITINFDDSYIIDKESERVRDMQEVRDGIKQKWEYRAKWYGEDEATAKAMIAEAPQITFGGDE